MSTILTQEKKGKLDIWSGLEPESSWPTLRKSLETTARAIRIPQTITTRIASVTIEKRSHLRPSSTYMPVLQEWIEKSDSAIHNYLVSLFAGFSELPKEISTIIEPDLLDKVSRNARERVFSFARYREGWDDGSGKALSGSSLHFFQEFLYVYSDFHSTPSLFLTRQGNIQIAWEGKEKQEIEMEFFPDGTIEYYLSSADAQTSDEESQTNFNDSISFENLIQKIRTIN